MITSKEDLKYFLEADAARISNGRKHPRLFQDEVWRYEIILRKREYYHNVKGFAHHLLERFYALRQHVLGVKLGFWVPINVCDAGLQINHYGLLIINGGAKIGKNFNVHQGVNIGQNIDADDVPTIGDNVFCGPGVKIYGKIFIADNIAIAAGSVVTKSFNTPNITIGGVPARVINPHRGNPFK
ncbi:MULTISPECIES: serine O-acetyltransferase [unclassified Bifidobacterium]|uniref:serine O-acetyltransferase n=1 Tax=unclassified Bifidobacterium TaxID=2608897 RepID=UPI00112A0AEE|nr:MULTISPECIES: serine acetyltransferase [unclassified Bifidobacterium]